MIGGKQLIAVDTTSAAPPAIVFALLKDAASWPEWTMVHRFELERPGIDDPLGVGAIRAFHVGPICAREQVTALVVDERFDYHLLSGVPLRDYHASVRLLATGIGGTTIRWSAEFGPQPFGTGIPWRWFMTTMLRRLAHGLAVGAERAALSPPPRSTTGR